MSEPVPDLTWLTPLYRTGAQAGELARRCAAASAALGLRHRILFVDDRCPEQGHLRVSALQAADPAVRLLRLAENLGQDGAIRAGLRETSGPVLVLDGDLQDPPESLPALWAVYQAGHDAVFADRRGAYESRGRLATSWLYRRTVSAVGGLPRGAGLNVLLGPRCAAAVAATTITPVYLLAAIAATRGRFASVPVLRDARAQGGSSYTSWRRLRKGLCSLLQTFRARRLGLRL